MKRTPILRPQDQLRLLGKLTPAPNGCQVFTGHATNDGYGVFSLKYEEIDYHQSIGAHRAAYLLFKGDIPNGMEVDHTCSNRPCCAEDHLILITKPDHRKQAGSHYSCRTHCSKGHPFTLDNTYTRTDGGCRRCKTCANAATQSHYERNRERWQKGGRYRPQD